MASLSLAPLAPEHFVIAMADTMTPEAARLEGAEYLRLGPAWALLLDGSVIFVGGILLPGRAQAIAWGRVTREGRRALLTIVRAARRALTEVIVPTIAVTEVVVTLPADRGTDLKLARVLGFRKLRQQRAGRVVLALATDHLTRHAGAPGGDS